MRIALLSDVHGNRLALDVCLERADALGVDERVFLGDAVGYLPDAAACVERLTVEGLACQQGNHEAMLLRPNSATREREAVYRLADARAQLAPGALAAIAGWPEARTLQRDGRRILLVHGSPDQPLDGYVYPDTVLDGWDDLPYDAVFMGHTHRPFVTRRGSTLIVNVGSVGLPRDVGHLASFVIYDTEADAARHYRVPFDADAVIAAAGDRLHPSTVACLRRSADQVVGEVLA
jgi:predicted phosphodiesterase